MEIIKEYHNDPTDKTNKFGMVKVKAFKELKKPVTLLDIKSNKELKDFIMLRQNRLSVLPLTEIEWKIICKMADLKNI